MKTGRARTRFCVAVVVCTAALACVMQTAEAVQLLTQEVSSFDSSASETALLASPEACLSDIGKRMLDPAAYTHPLSASKEQTRTLPAVPAAVFMTMFGFVCFSLGRDRRAWLALAAGLLWLGQAGLHAVPQLAHRARSRASRQTTQTLCLSFSHIAHLQPTGRDEQTGYAGLLHKLAAIPDEIAALASITNTAGRSVRQAHRPAAPCAILNAAEWTNTANECPDRATRHIVRFSPAFTYKNLARGPPDQEFSRFSRRALGSEFARHSRNGYVEESPVV